MVDKYAVFGNPVTHSKSPFIHREFAKQEHEKIDYQAVQVPLDGFALTVNAFINEGGKGGNVTAPFKEQAFELCDEVSFAAQQAKAVNTLIVTQDGQLKGENTDGLGLVADLVSQFGDIRAKRILIVGAGGATRGCLLPLLNAKVASITVTNRTVTKMQILMSEFDDQRLGASSYEELKGDRFDIIINATSASLTEQVPNIPASLIHSKVYCYDMVYLPQMTAFCVWAKQHGAAKVVDGLGMLVKQAAASYAIWRGVQPDVTKVEKQLRIELKAL